MTAAAYKQIISAPSRDRLDLFLATANRLGAPVGNVEKDFWVCWTLNALYHELPAGGPRLLFKGGTSLSKAYGLISRFSEDIDITVFRDDLDEPATVEELEALSNKKRRAKLDAIKDACRAYITGSLRGFLGTQLADATGGVGRIEIDEADPDGQTLLVWYPEVEPRDGRAYVWPAVRIESGAKSALDPSRPVRICPYISEEAATLDLAVGDVTTIEATRTFWDKIVIVHGLRRWYERRGVLRQEGQRVSRHYYDLHCLLDSEVGEALADRVLGADCVRHARMFFDRPDYDLASAVPGTLAIAPVSGMVDALKGDYAKTGAMIYGTVPRFEEILESTERIEATLNRRI